MDLRDLYYLGLSKIDIGSVSKSLLERDLAGDDTGQDFEDALRTDSFFTAKILEHASSVMKRGTLKSLSHAVVLLGKEPVRNFVLGHSILRAVDSEADNKFVSFDESRAVLKRARAAEEFARRAGCEHVSSALAAGLLFDLFENWLLSNEKLKKEYSALFEATWRHCLTSAAIAWSLASHEKVLIHLKKMVFATAMSHEIGRLLLCLTYPDQYMTLLGPIQRKSQEHPESDGAEAGLETSVLGISHTEAGSLAVWKCGFLEEYEAAVDFHHDFSLLKARDQDLFLLLVTIQLADNLAFLLQSVREPGEEQLNRLVEQNRQYFPLRASQINEVLAVVRAKNLLVL